MKAKIIVAQTHMTFEDSLNEYLETIDPLFYVNIQYSFASTEHEQNFTALVIVEKPQVINQEQ